MKKFILFLSALFLFGLSSCAVKADVRAVARALDNEEGIASSQVVSEVGSVFSESTEKADTASQVADEERTTLVGKAASWIEEKVVPLFGLVSVGNVLTIVGFVITLVLKSKGEKKYREEREADNKSYVAKIDSLEKKVISLENKVAELETADSKRSDDYTKMTDGVEKIIVTAKDIFNATNKQNESIGGVLDMKNAIEVSCKLMAKSLALSDVAVKSGIAEDAQKLIETIEGGNSDGGKED